MSTERAFRTEDDIREIILMINTHCMDFAICTNLGRKCDRNTAYAECNLDTMPGDSVQHGECANMWVILVSTML